MGDNNNKADNSSITTPSFISTAPSKDGQEDRSLPEIVDHTEDVGIKTILTPPPTKVAKVDPETKERNPETEALSTCGAKGIEQLARKSGFIDSTGQTPSLIDGGLRDKPLQHHLCDEGNKTVQESSELPHLLHFKTELVTANTHPGPEEVTLPSFQQNGHPEKHKKPPGKRGPKPRANTTESTGKEKKSGNTGGSSGGGGSENGEGNGLKHFSSIVRRKVEELGTTTYKDVADILTKESQAEAGKGQAISEKNLQRRVYDVLNVLAAIGAVKKEKKTISWRGMPEKITDVPEATPSPPQLPLSHPQPPPPPPPSSGEEESFDDTLEGLYHNRKSWAKLLENKRKQALESEENLRLCKNLVERNRQMLPYRPQHVLPIPFVVAVTNKNSYVSGLFSESGQNLRMNFTDNFKIYKYKKILACMGEAEADAATAEDPTQENGGAFGDETAVNTANGYMTGLDSQMYQNNGYMNDAFYDMYDDIERFAYFQDGYNPLLNTIEDFSTFPQSYSQQQQQQQQIQSPTSNPSQHEQEQEQEQEQERHPEQKETNTEKQPPKLPQL